MLTPWNERPLSVYCTAEAPGAQSRLIAGNQLNDWMHMIVITTIIFLKEMRMARNKRLPKDAHQWPRELGVVSSPNAPEEPGTSHFDLVSCTLASAGGL